MSDCFASHLEICALGSTSQRLASKRESAVPSLLVNHRTPPRTIHSHLNRWFARVTEPEMPVAFALAPEARFICLLIIPGQYLAVEQKYALQLPLLFFTSPQIARSAPVHQAS